MCNYPVEISHFLAISPVKLQPLENCLEMETLKKWPKVNHQILRQLWKMAEFSVAQCWLRIGRIAKQVLSPDQRCLPLAFLPAGSCTKSRSWFSPDLRECAAAARGWLSILRIQQWFSHLYSTSIQYSYSAPITLCFHPRPIKSSCSGGRIAAERFIQLNEIFLKFSRNQNQF